MTPLRQVPHTPREAGGSRGYVRHAGEAGGRAKLDVRVWPPVQYPVMSQNRPGRGPNLVGGRSVRSHPVSPEGYNAQAVGQEPQVRGGRTTSTRSDVRPSVDRPSRSSRGVVVGQRVHPVVIEQAVDPHIRHEEGG